MESHDPFGNQAAAVAALGFAPRPYDRFAFVEDVRQQAHMAGIASSHQARPTNKFVLRSQWKPMS